MRVPTFLVSLALYLRLAATAPVPNVRDIVPRDDAESHGMISECTDVLSVKLTTVRKITFAQVPASVWILAVRLELRWAVTSQKGAPCRRVMLPLSRMKMRLRRAKVRPLSSPRYFPVRMTTVRKMTFAQARSSVDSEASVNASSVNSHADIYQDVNLGANQVQEGGSSLAQKLVQMGTLGAQLNANEE